MKAHVAALLVALQSYQHQIAIDVCFCLAVLSSKYLEKIRSNIKSGALINATVTLAILAVSTYTLMVTSYTLLPNYLDPNEPVVASISWLWLHGHQLYPNWMTGDIRVSMYGPLDYLINGAALLLGPSIFASKLPGVSSLAAALGVISICLKRTTGSALTTLFLLTLLIMLIATFGNYAYWDRPEPFLILLSALALLIITSRFTSWVIWVVIGVLAGLASGFKIDGFIYLTPAAAVALAKVEGLRARISMVTIGAICCAAIVVVPYFGKDTSTVGFLRALGVLLREQWSAPLFIENLQFVMVLAAPVAIAWIWQQQPLNRSDKWLLVALFFSIATLSVLGAKRGAGSYYILPLMPFWIYGIAALCATAKMEQIALAALIFISFSLAYSPNLLLSARQTYLFSMYAPLERDKIAELKSDLNSYPDAQLGISDVAHFPNYSYTVFSVWNGRPLYVDFNTWQDLAHVGVDEKHIMQLIEGCTVRTWILPLGTPFTKTNYYNGLPLLSENFRQTFLANYRRIKTGQSYQIWACKQ